MEFSAAAPPPRKHSPQNSNEEETSLDPQLQVTYKKFDEIYSTFPKAKGWRGRELTCYQGFWFDDFALRGMLLIQEHFKPLHTDIFLASHPKSGTTWLKALIFAMMNRVNHEFSSHPLLSKNPHELVPYLETLMYRNDKSINPEVEALPSPRLLQTHVPYSMLPQPMTDSGTKFVYVFREAKDVLVSMWCFLKSIRPKELPDFPLEEVFEQFSQGATFYGPYWDHVLGYWKAALEAPEKVLFLRYEDLKEEPVANAKLLAEFLGQPFSGKEEAEGVVDQVIKLCSFQNLSNLEVNKLGAATFSVVTVDHEKFFRKGTVGDWKNHLTAEMVESLNQIMEKRFSGTGFKFGVN